MNDAEAFLRSDLDDRFAGLVAGNELPGPRFDGDQSGVLLAMKFKIYESDAISEIGTK